MRFARTYTDFQNRGAEITAISVDTPEQNRAMIDKLLLPFRLLSDPDGSLAIKPYGVWNDKAQIALPSVFVVGQDGTIRYQYTGQDFADRPGDDAIFATLDAGGVHAAR